MGTNGLSAPVPDKTEAERTGERAVQWFSWRMGSSALRLVVQFVVLAILAHLIEARDLGLLGLAVIVTGIATTVAEMGIGPALIQRPDLTAGHLRVGFTLALGAGVLGMLVVWALAPATGLLFRDAEVVSVVRFVAIALPFDGAGIVARSLLLRRLDFKREFWVEACANLIGYAGVTLGLAFAGYGVWAPAAGFVARSVVGSAALLLAAPHPRRFLMAPREASEILRFGVGVTLTRVANFAAANTDYVVVGIWLGAEAVGVYQYAYQIGQLPVSYFTVQLSYVLFPAFAALRADPRRCGSLYGTALTAVTLFVLPSAVAIAISAPELIPVVLGDRWGRVVLPAQVLCVGAVFHAAYNLSDALARASGAVYQQAGRHASYALAVFVGSMLGLRWDLVGVSAGVVAAMAVICLLMLELGRRFTGHSWLEVGRMCAPGALVAFATGIGGISGTQVGRALQLPQTVSLVVTLLGCAIGALVGFAWIRHSRFGAAVGAMLADAAEMLPFAKMRTATAQSWMVRLKVWGGRIPGLRRAVWEGRLLAYAARSGLWRAALASGTGVGLVSQQRILTWDVSIPPMASASELENWLREQQVVIDAGGHTLYLRPQERLRSVLGGWVDLYPPDAGFKLLRDLRPPSEARYVTRRWGGLFEAALTGIPAEQLVTGNFLYAEGLSPRVYDLCRLRTGSMELSTFVVQHIDGVTPTEHQCEQFLSRLAGLIKRTELRVTHPGWRTKADFQPPDCKGNLLVPRNSNEPLYVDFQAFRLLDASAWLQRNLNAGESALRFREECRPDRRGLYQSLLADEARSAEGDVSKRWGSIQRQFERNAVSVEGRLILDVGCNAGTMMVAALRAGAMWGVGWDSASVIPRAKLLLLSLGLTRFMLLGADLHQGYSLEEDLPDHLSSLLAESVVLYRSAGRYTGLLACLERLPWRVLVYEGNVGEQPDELEEHVSGVLRSDVRLVSCAYSAGELSACRPFVLLLRT